MINLALDCGDMQKVHRKGTAKRRDEDALDLRTILLYSWLDVEDLYSVSVIGKFA